MLIEPDPQARKARRAKMLESRAVRMRQRIRLSRATSETELGRLLPETIVRGDSWHVISGGNIDGLSYLSHMLRCGRADHVLLSTWCMSLDDVQQLQEWLANGSIGLLDVYVGEIFPSQYKPAFELLCDTIRQHADGAGRVAVFRNHAKVTVMAAHARNQYLVCESSANLNTNPRTEQTSITHSRRLAEFYRDFYAGVKSIVKNFPDWQPHGWPPAKAKRAQAC